MHVLHVSAYYAPAFSYGGPVRSIHALCQAQQAQGLQVEVFTTTANGASRLSPAPEGRAVDGVKVRYFELSAPARLLGAADLPAALTRALSAADVVHLHGLFNRTVWDAASCLQTAGTPYVLSPRGMLEPAALAHHRWRKRLTWTLRDRQVVARAAVLHATAANERRTLEDTRPGARVVQIPNPVPIATAPERAVDAGERWRAARGIHAEAPIVLSLGRLHRIKRLDLVADAFLALRQRVPSAQLVIAGPDEQGLVPDLERRLAPVAAGVHWTGFVEDEAKQALIAASTVLVQCSDSESFGMSVAEALGAGTPVVVSRTCPWEDIEAWGCGLWVEQSADAIAGAIADIVSHPARAREMGNAGRRMIQERMSPASVADRWGSVYRDIARSRPAAA